MYLLSKQTVFSRSYIHRSQYQNHVLNVVLITYQFNSPLLLPKRRSVMFIAITKSTSSFLVSCRLKDVFRSGNKHLLPLLDTDLGNMSLSTLSHQPTISLHFGTAALKRVETFNSYWTWWSRSAVYEDISNS